MNVLVLGAGGMAGHVVALYLRENGHTVDTLSAKHALDKDTHLIDVTDQRTFKAFLDAHTYDVVINCIGLLVKPSEERKDLAVYINSYLPHFLEQYYRNRKTKVIHISTDAVFSGMNAPYQEDSPYNGESFYGRTKAIGEIINDKDLTFRMSIIGPAMAQDGTGLFNWFYMQTREITGYTNAIWNGITTLELAKGITAAIKQDIVGVYHLVPEENISKFDLLQLFQETFNRKEIRVRPAAGKTVDLSLTNTRKDFRHHVPGYKTMVHDMKTWIYNHPTLYKHYAKT